MFHSGSNKPNLPIKLVLHDWGWQVAKDLTDKPNESTIEWLHKEANTIKDRYEITEAGPQVVTGDLSDEEVDPNDYNYGDLWLCGNQQEYWDAADRDKQRKYWESI